MQLEDGIVRQYRVSVRVGRVGDRGRVGDVDFIEFFKIPWRLPASPDQRFRESRCHASGLVSAKVPYSFVFFFDGRTSME